MEEYYTYVAFLKSTAKLKTWWTFDMLELFSMSKKIDQGLWVAGKIRHYENNKLCRLECSFILEGYIVGYVCLAAFSDNQKLQL